MNPLTEARLNLHQRLVEAGFDRVYSGVPEKPTAPCIIIGGPRQGTWVTRRLSGVDAVVELNVRVMVPRQMGSRNSVELLESMVWDVMGVVMTTTATAATTLSSQGGAEVYYSDLVATMKVKG